MFGFLLLRFCCLKSITHLNTCVDLCLPRLTKLNHKLLCPALRKVSASCACSNDGFVCTVLTPKHFLKEILQEWFAFARDI